MHCLIATYADYSFTDGANRTLMLGSGRHSDYYRWIWICFVSTVELAAALLYTGVPLVFFQLSVVLVGGWDDDLVSDDMVWIRLSTGNHQLRFWLLCGESHLRLERRYFDEIEWPRFDVAFDLVGGWVDLTDNSRWPCFPMSDTISLHTLQQRSFGRIA